MRGSLQIKFIRVTTLILSRHTLRAVQLSIKRTLLELRKRHGKTSNRSLSASYSDVQKSVPVKLARLLLDITIGCCFDSHPRIDSVLQNSGFRYGLLENAIEDNKLLSAERVKFECHERL